MKVDCQRLHDSGSFRPSNPPPSPPFPPHHMQIGRFWKQVQKNLEIGTSNLEISKVCLKLKKKKKTNYLFECFFTFLVPPVVFFCCFFRSRVLEKGGHFQICACVWKLSFPRDLSAPMFYWKWHCTQVFSQISLINRLLWTQIIRYSFILCRSFRHCQGFLAHREI